MASSRPPRCMGSFGQASWGTAVRMPIARIAQIRLLRPGAPDVVAYLH